MKKILAVLLALITLISTLSLVSCNKHKEDDPGKDLPPVVDPDNPDKPDTPDTPDTPDVPTDTDDPSTPDVPDTPVTPTQTEIVWTDCDEIVYIVASTAYLRTAANKEATLISMPARLGESYKRVAVSENWSRIIVNVGGADTEAYIVNDAVTTEDLSTDKFEVYTEPVLRYVAVSSLNVRSFPTLNNNAYYKTLTQNAEITVIGFRQDEDMSWYMIHLKNEDGSFITNADGSNTVFFVSGQPKYTSETQIEVAPAETGE